MLIVLLTSEEGIRETVLWYKKVWKRIEDEWQVSAIQVNGLVISIP
jgi:hypothetical protein